MVNKTVAQYWKSGVVILTPIILLPLPLLVQTAAARCGYVIILMAFYWSTEAVHLSATALIPIFAFPLLGILSTSDVCKNYLKDTNMLFLGGLAMAVAIEHAGLHKRIALFILSKIGASSERLLLGFMLSQMFLSMWISNTAATAMMIPIVDAVLSSIQKKQGEEHKPPEDWFQLQKVDCRDDVETHRKRVQHSTDGECKDKNVQRKRISSSNLRDIIYMGVAYASNIGGTGSLTGTNPNLVLIGFLQLFYQNQETGINYATWLLFNVPGMVLCTVVGYIWLSFFLYYYNGWKRSHDREAEREAQDLLDKEYESLHGMTFQEGVVSALFCLAIILWVFRKPEIITGWGPLIEEFTGTQVSGATPAMFVVFLMFVIPSQKFWKKNSEGVPNGPSPGCLTWHIFHHKVPWGVIILIGSGFAIAEAGKTSGLSQWLGLQFSSLDSLPKEATLFILCVLTALLTEVMSNTAASSILIPVLNDLSLAIKVNPLYFLLPVTICSSYAFMLPVATPPNAIVFEAAKTMPITRMMFCGSMMNVLCIVIAYTMQNTLGNYMFDYTTFPQWANMTQSS